MVWKENPSRLQHAAEVVVVGQRAVMHEALVRAGRIGVDAVGGHRPTRSPCGYGRWRGCRSFRRGPKRSATVSGPPDLLVEFHAVASADEVDLRRLDERASRRDGGSKSCAGDGGRRRGCRDARRWRRRKSGRSRRSTAAARSFRPQAPAAQRELRGIAPPPRA